MLYQQQHDFHLIPWLKAKFNLTVRDNEKSYNQTDWWLVHKGDHDLDIEYVTDGPSIFGAALEYGACYDGELCDKLVELEIG